MKNIFLSIVVFPGFLFSQEVMPVEIPLNGEAAERSLEMSGLAWYGDYLILMPQYVKKEAPGFYVVSKTKIQRWLNGNRSDSLTPEKIDLIQPQYDLMIPGYQGFEALTFSGKDVYLIIESKNNDTMRSFLIKGKMDLRRKKLTINSDAMEEIPLPIQIENMGIESILKFKYRLLTLYEVNGANVNPKPAGYFYNTGLKPKGEVSFPHLEYRLTDVTEVDGQGRFWAVNFFWPGERKRLKPAHDSVLDGTIKGETHSKFEHLERLVEYRLNADEIVRTDSKPIQLVLNKISRNWEGLVRLENQGFLMIVDEHPRTILAFVPFPKN